MSIAASGGDRIRISPQTDGVLSLPTEVSVFFSVVENLTSTIVTYDVARFVSVPDQVTDQTTFDVEAIRADFPTLAQEGASQEYEDYS